MTEAERLAAIRRAKSRRDAYDERLEILILDSVEAGDRKTAIAEAAGLSRQGLHWILNNRKKGAA